jgi:uncharacterized Tic20 family protein
MPPSAPYSPPPVSGGVAPAGYANAEDKTWSLVAHFGGALGTLVICGIGGWIAPLIALLVQGPKSPTVRTHALAALNFQVTWAVIDLVVYYGGGLVLCGFGYFFLWIVFLVPLIFGIIGGIKANEGVLYKYPLSVNLIK